MNEFALLTFELEGISVTKSIRVRGRVHPDGATYTPEEERVQTVIEIAHRSREAARDIAAKLYPP